MTSFLTTRGMGGLTLAAAGMGSGYEDEPPEPTGDTGGDTEETAGNRTIRARLARDSDSCSGIIR